MAAPALKRLLVHFAHYSLASVLTTIAGLISFPLLTRIFSVADYGTMNLVGATLTIAVAVGKLGVQHAIVRFHSEIAAGKRPFTMPQLYSTMLAGMGATGLATTAIVLAGTRLLPLSWFGDPRMPVLFAIASGVIVAQVVESALFNVVRAELGTSLLVKYQVAKKYLGLGLIVFAVFVVARDLRAFYAATLLTEIGAVVGLAFVMFRGGERPRPSLAQRSMPLYREMLAFGIPMMIGYELSGTVLAVGDRYVIEALIGVAPLGLYSAAYNLCQYVQSVLITSVGLAITPIYMQMWDQRGRDETARFIDRSLRTYALFGVPVIAGVAALGPELLPAVASDKYAGAGAILPWVIAGMVVDGMNAMVGAGLFIHRRTRAIMLIVSSGAVLNIGLNLVLVPRVGIQGAAIATLVSYSTTAVLLAVAGRALLPVRIPWATAARAGIASLAMYAAIFRVGVPGRRLVTLGLQLPLGAAVYAAVIVALDADARALGRKIVGRLRRART